MNYNKWKKKAQVRHGVPPTMRPWAWMEMSGAAKKKASVPSSNYYATMATAGLSSPAAREIEQARARAACSDRRRAPLFCCAQRAGAATRRRSNLSS
jgi:hypothetical protein